MGAWKPIGDWRVKRRDNPYQIITVNLPRSHVEALDKLRDHGTVPSRSEAVRVAVRDYLREVIQLEEGIIEFLNEANPNIIQVPGRDKPYVKVYGKNHANRGLE